MDWDIARRAYFDALTKGTSAERDQNLAKTFQALGQVVHLVQDLAVPAHVRDDFASHGEYFEPGFTAPIRWWANDFERYIRRNSGLITGGQPLNPISFMDQPVTRFWDTGQYRQSAITSRKSAQSSGTWEFPRPSTQSRLSDRRAAERNGCRGGRTRGRCCLR
jgi:hypothetical protein